MHAEAKPDVRRRWRLPWYAYAFVALLLLLAVLIAAAWFYPDVRAWQIERDVAAALPTGSTDTQVDAWLNAIGIPHSEDRQGDIGFSGNVSYYNVTGTVPAGCNRIIEARIYHVHPILQIDIVLWFFFDKDGKLISHDVRQEWTFL